MKSILVFFFASTLSMHMFAQDRFLTEVDKALRMLERNITISDCDSLRTNYQTVLYSVMLDSSGGISCISILSTYDNCYQKELERISCLLKLKWVPAKSNYSMILIPVILLSPESDDGEGCNKVMSDNLNLFFQRNSEVQILPGILVSKPVSITYYRTRKW